MSTLLSLPLLTMRGLAAFVLAGCAMTAGASPSDISAQWHPTPADKLKLPQYCWSQFDENFAKQTGIKMPTEICGVMMNHFCPSLVMLNRAQESKYHPNTRHDMMQEALSGIAYTYRGMPPNCPLKPDLDAAKAKANAVAPLIPRGTR
jgi:hypothetical protein